MVNFFRKKKIIGGASLFLIVGLAFVVRFWNFAPWLYFELDQSRDALIVQEAWDKGPGYLPLLGPRAAGTFLRLGPVEYYFQYLSAVIFDSAEPWVLAYPALLFSLLSIGVFYFLIRNFFSLSVSLLTTAIYASSFILTQYARFAWNPNEIPFWGLLFILAIYKSSTEENRGKAGFWLLGAGLSYAVVSQLHFLALVGFPIVAVLFWIFYFPKKIKLRFWLGAVSLLLVFYLSVIFSEISTSGDNFRQFQYAFSVKTGGEITGSFVSKMSDDLRQTAIAFSMFTTSFGHKDSRVAFWFGTFLLLGGFLRAGWLAKKDEKKRLLLWLLLSWLSVFLFLYFKTETSLKPRFFFPITAVPFFLLAYLLDFFVVFNKRKKFSYVLMAFLSGFFVWVNLNATKQWYAFLRTADDKVINRKMELKQASGVTLESLKAVASFMAETAGKNEKTVCYDGLAEYKRSLDYFLDNNLLGIERARIVRGMSEKDKRNCQWFSLAQKKTGKMKMSANNEKYFQGSLVYQSGALAVWSLTANEEFYLVGEKTEVKKEETVAPEMATDQEIDSEEQILPEDEPVKSETKETKKPKRQERVYWKDVF